MADIANLQQLAARERQRFDGTLPIPAVRQTPNQKLLEESTMRLLEKLVSVIAEQQREIDELKR